MNSVYAINKGVHQPIVFKGLKGQWIHYLAGGLVALFLVFVFCYLLGVPLVVCSLGLLVLGVVLFYIIYRCNRKYGRDGFMKQYATRLLPKHIKQDQFFIG